MAQDTSGIMGLQEDYLSQGKLPPEIGLEVADGALKNLAPQAVPEMDKFTSELSGQLAKLSDEELDIFIQLVQQLYDEPDNYAENRAHLIQGGDLTEEDLPPDYQPEALATMLYVLRKEKQARSGKDTSAELPSSMPPMAGAAPAEMQPPQGFARGGIAEAARIVAGGGRNGDTMLAHITPREAKLLRKHGGSGTINPATGLPEYGFFSFLKDIWNVVWQPVKKLLNTTVGKIISQVALNVLIPGYGSIIAAGLQTAAADGKIGDIVKNMAIAGVTSYLSGGLADKGMPSPIQGPLNSLAEGLNITSEAGRMALNQGVVTAGMGLVQGQSLKDAATSGITAAATVQAANYAGKLFSPQGQYNETTGKVEGNRLINNDTNAMQDQMGLGKAPIDDRGTFSPPTNAPLSNPSSLIPAGSPAATTSTVNTPSINAQTSVAAPVGVNPTSSTADLYKPVGVGDAVSTMGQGAKQILTGDVSKGFDTLGTGAKDLFMPSGPTDKQILDLKKSYQAQDPTLSSADALKMAQNQGPGVLRTYGPAAAAGLGIMAMAGGFSPQGPQGNPNGPQFRGPTGEDLLKADPKKYLVQGMPGVQYDAQGNIIGNQGQYPYATMNDVRVASNYGTQARYADGGIAHLATGGPANGAGHAGFGMDPNDPQMVEYRNMVQSLTPAARQYMAAHNNNGAFADMNMMRQAMAYSAQEAARRAPAQENQLYAANPQQYQPNMTRPSGIAGLAMGGYPRKTGQISGPGTETSDSVPAMLSDGEFVMTARAVRGLGKGDRREGAKKMYALMHQLERNAARG